MRLECQPDPERPGDGVADQEDLDGLWWRAGTRSWRASAGESRDGTVVVVVVVVGAAWSAAGEPVRGGGAAAGATVEVVVDVGP